ncbi:MAG: hypothetical protein IIV90_03795 [Oscillospiraceae bacterium]|nr:hypothetical protein [Oscillospiraceae bacterium]
MPNFFLGQGPKNGNFLPKFSPFYLLGGRAAGRFGGGGGALWRLAQKAKPNPYKTHKKTFSGGYPLSFLLILGGLRCKIKAEYNGAAPLRALKQEAYCYG